MRLPNSYGSVTKLSGKRRRPYMVRKTTGWTDDGKQIMEVIGYYHTRAEAMEALVEYNKSPIEPALRKRTFADIYAAWGELKYKGAPIPNSYAAAYEYCKALHDLIFADIKTAQYQTVIDKCPMSTATKKNIKILCNQMTKYALANDIIAKNYIELCTLPSQEDSTKHKPFTDDELQELWKLSDHKNVQTVLILCYTGMRPTELLKIEAKNVNLEEHYMLGGIKTAAGKNRVIPIADKILPFVKNLLAEGHTMLLEDADGPLNYDKYRPRYFETAMRLLPIEMRDHLPHDGRHTCATLMDNAEINAKIKKLILGHSGGGDVTEKIYTHKTISQLVEAINKI